MTAAPRRHALAAPSRRARGRFAADGPGGPRRAADHDHGGLRDDHQRPAPGRSSACSGRPEKLDRLTAEIEAGEDDAYLDAVVKETLRVAAGGARGRKASCRGDRTRRLRDPGRLDADGLDLPRAQRRRTYPEPDGVQARAIPRRNSRRGSLDPVRGRSPALSRRTLRRARDEGRAHPGSRDCTACVQWGGRMRGPSASVLPWHRKEEPPRSSKTWFRPNCPRQRSLPGGALRAPRRRKPSQTVDRYCIVVASFSLEFRSNCSLPNSALEKCPIWAETLK